MDAMANEVMFHPMSILGTVAVAFAVSAFLLFLRGFLSHVKYIFTLNGNDDYMREARIRVMWSFMLLLLIYAVWETIRWMAALVGGNPRPTTIWLAIVIYLLLLSGYLGVEYMKKNELAK
jgi:hypothetical protein